ncbi:MAG: hypothetical protein WC233_03535 [Sphaerochaeta sp.]
MKRTVRSVAALLAIVLISGCTVTQQLDYHSAKERTASFDFEVEDFFVAVLEDFSDFSPAEGDEDLMDKAIRDFERALQRSPATSGVSLDKVDENSWYGYFTVHDLERLIVDLGAGANQTLLTLTDDSLSFFLSMDNYDQLVPVIPFLADPNFEAFGPVYNQGLSEEDYLEMISFMLGEEGVPAIEESTITLTLRTPRPVKSFTAGTKRSADLYEFSFPLIDFLLLADPITFTVRW